MESKTQFRAINPVQEIPIVTPTTSDSKRGWRIWGDDNRFPNYVEGLTEKSPTLHSILEGFVQYVCGEGIDGDWGFDINEVLKETAQSIGIWGGFAWHIVKGVNGNPTIEAVIPLKHIRTDEDNECFWYSEDFGACKKGKEKSIDELPRFVKGFAQDEAIFMLKVWGTREYPMPCYVASIPDAETEAQIAQYHLNQILNGFTASAMVNLNNGIVEDEQAEEIEESFTEKFSGSQNAGRLLFSWNADKEHEATIIPFSTENWGDKYKALSEHCRQSLFTSFRANPNLFGIPTEGKGFSNEEYEESFRLYNRTQIVPVQKTIIRAFGEVLGIKPTIVPFTM